MSQPNLSPDQISELKALIEGAELSLQQAKKMLGMAAGETNGALARKAAAHGGFGESDEGQVVEGVFDGQHMIGPDGKQYSVPANYASKSKLVEGDLMKLTIGSNGHFMYKQIGPIERARIVGTLTRDEESNEWRVVAEGRSYKVILASVTYFKGEEGDEITIMVPKDKSSNWAAVENIIKPSGSANAAPAPAAPSGFTPVKDTPAAPSTPAAPAVDEVPNANEPASAASNNDQLYATPPAAPAQSGSSAIPTTFTPSTPATPEPAASEPEQPIQQGGNYGALTFDEEDEFDKI